MKCYNCGSTDFFEKKRSMHLGIYCRSCLTWITWKEQENDWKQFKMPIGKYKGQHLPDIPEEYRKWCVENMNHKFVRYIKESLNV